jgi:uncharacterized protein (TIGR02284 family)
MSNSLSETISTLNNLIETCKDGQEGFRLAAEAVTDDEDLKAFLFSCSLQRSKFAGELQSEVMSLGEPSPTETSSVAAALHRGWINIKSVVTMRDNHAILAECERGEDVAVAQYRKAVNSGLSDPLREVVNNQFQEVLATHNTVRDMRDELASQLPPSRTAKQVVHDVQDTLREKGRALGSTAADTWETTRTKTDDVLRTTEEYVRENPFPAILTAVGVGFALGLLVRYVERASEPEKIEVPIPRAVQQVRDFDFKAAVLPFLWPVIKFFSTNYAASRKSVNRAYKQAKDFDAGRYVDPVVKRVKKSF